MTANDLRYNVLVGVDSLYQGTAPGYNDKQMSAILNRAQRRVFRDKSKLFDTDEKIKRMLAPLLKRGSVGRGDIIAATDTDITNYPHSVTNSLSSAFYQLPSDLGFLKEEYAILTTDDVASNPVIVLPITYDYFTKNYNSRYKMPYTDLIWRMDVELDVNTSRPVIELIYPYGSTLTNYITTYLRYPTDIVVNVGTPGSQVDCEVPDASFQDEIVGEAVKIIVAALNDQDYQTVVVEKKFDEN
jgi:hypothetical protein